MLCHISYAASNLRDYDGTFRNWPLLSHPWEQACQYHLKVIHKHSLTKEGSISYHGITDRPLIKETGDLKCLGAWHLPALEIEKHSGNASKVGTRLWKPPYHQGFCILLLIFSPTSLNRPLEATVPLLVSSVFLTLSFVPGWLSTWNHHLLHFNMVDSCVCV